MFKKCLLYFTVCLLLASTFGGYSFAKAENISISAKSAVVIELESEKIIFSKNADNKMPMASTTKIMSALLTLESGGLDDYFKVDNNAIIVEGSSMGLKLDYMVSKRSLAIGMLLMSGNDGANAAAVSVAGSQEKFVLLMNEKARQLGLKNTSFANPSGLDNVNHYTTAFDLGKLAAYALHNNDFKEICCNYSMTTSYGNPPFKRQLYNHNKLLNSYKGAIGVKTGFTKRAGRCLVSAAERDGITLIAVTLDASNDWSDHARMLDYGFSVTERVTLDSNLSGVKIPVVGGDRSVVEAYTDTGAYASLVTEDKLKVERKLELSKFLYAPIKSGDIIGEVNYYLDGKALASIKIRSVDTVNYVGKIKDANNKKGFFKSIIDFFKRK